MNIMAPIIVSEGTQYLSDGVTIVSKGTSPDTRNNETTGYGTIVVLPDVISDHEDDERNENEIRASKSQEEEMEDNDVAAESESENFREGKLETIIYDPSRSSNLFADDNEICGSDNDNFAELFQACKTNSPQSIISNLMTGSSRRFEFPRLNTYMGNDNGEITSPRVAIPSPSAFFSNMRLPSSLTSSKKNQHRSSPLSLDGLFSPSSSGEMVDVDLQHSLSDDDLKNVASSVVHNKPCEKEKDSMEETAVAAKSTTQKKAKSPSTSFFGLEPFPWEIKSFGTQTTSSTSNDGPPESTSSTSWFSDSIKSISNSTASTFSSNQISDSFKKWGKEISAAASDFFNEDVSKDAFVAHFGRQVSRHAAESMYEHYPNAV